MGKVQFASIMYYVTTGAPASADRGKVHALGRLLPAGSLQYIDYLGT